MIAANLMGYDLFMLHRSHIKHFFSMLKINIFFVAILAAVINTAHAADEVSDKFRIAVGGYSVFRYDSTMSLTEPNLGAGVSISPDDTLGVDNRQTVLRLNGYYRFTREHMLTYSWYSISSQGNKTVDKEFDWVDENGGEIIIPVGARVDASLDYDIFKVGYLWSFYHTDKVELAAGAGLHVARISVDVLSDVTSSGVRTRDVSTTVPLPVLSFGLIYNVTPRFGWYLKAEAFALKFDDWDGLYTDSSLGIEYRVLDNIGLGVGLGTNSLNVIERTDDYEFVYDNRITGIVIEVAAYF